MAFHSDIFAQLSQWIFEWNLPCAFAISFSPSTITLVCVPLPISPASSLADTSKVIYVALSAIGDKMLLRFQTIRPVAVRAFRDESAFTYHFKQQLSYSLFPDIQHIKQVGALYCFMLPCIFKYGFFLFLGFYRYFLPLFS